MKWLRVQAGMSVVELIVAMAIMSVVGAMVVVFLLNASRAYVRSDEETRGLWDAKQVFDQLGTDVRSSAGVLCDGGLADPGDPNSADPSCSAHLQLWVDSDSDYVSEPSETITWFLRANGEHHDVVRQDGSGAERVMATTLVRDVLFTYDTGTPGDASIVTATMTYDARVGAGSGERTVSTSVRIRNGRLS